MKSIDVYRHRMLESVSQFGATNRDLFPDSRPAGRLFAAISQAVGQLDARVVEEECGQNAERRTTSMKATTRDALRQALEAIARTAGGFDPGAKGLANRFRLPSVRNDHELTTAARSFARDAAPLKARFCAHGLPKTFLADLRAALVAFEDASQQRFAVREVRATAAAGIRASLRAALIALKRLDAIVPNAIGDDPGLQATWTLARHVGRARTARRRTATDAASAAPVSPAAAAPSTTARDARATA